MTMRDIFIVVDAVLSPVLVKMRVFRSLLSVWPEFVGSLVVSWVLHEVACSLEPLIDGETANGRRDRRIVFVMCIVRTNVLPRSNPFCKCHVRALE